MGGGLSEPTLGLEHPGNGSGNGNGNGNAGNP
jgi:hypothetical protein